MKVSVRIFVVLAALFAAGTLVSAQSSDQLFPTPVRSSEILSTIKARDIGDSRLTTYYYTFEGEQGDVFINVQSRNFTGDIDLFVVPGQVPLTKIVIYGDQPETETGRVVYLRKPERLLLRVQGRTPGDDEASIRIKFAGSFSTSKVEDTANDPPTVGSTSETNVRVNSVGTILEVIPKAKPTPEAVAEKVDLTRNDDTDSKDNERVPTDAEEEKVDESEKDVTAKKDPSKVKVVVTDAVVEEKKPNSPPRSPSRSTRRRTTASRSKAPAKTPETVDAEVDQAEAKKEEASPKATPANRRATTRNRVRAKAAETTPEEPKVDPMANVRLVVYFKDGSTIERPMTEVQRFAVEKAVLTIIGRNGSVGRYQMIDIQKVSIE